MSEMVFSGCYDSLDAIREYFGNAARSAGMDGQEVYDVQLAADEAASNIIDHAYKGEHCGDIICSFTILPDGLEITLKDQGSSFDPELIKLPDVTKGFSHRKSHGLGLHFMRSVMDIVEFGSNDQGGNVTRMYKSRK
jgi:serine/threonine-protein kinase RsbW